MIDLENPVLDFSAMDRCERCGAQAVTLAYHEKFGDLLFCAHHRRDYEKKLLDDGWLLIDDAAQMEKLVAKV